MMETEFVIPNKSVELLSVSNSQYYVSDVSTSREISKEFSSFRENLDDEGVDFIPKNFDKFFSIIRCFSELPTEVKIDSYQILIDASYLLASDLASILEEGGDISDPCLRFRYRNLTKMNLYLLCQLAKEFETEMLKPSLVVTQAKKGRKKKAPEEISRWSEKRNDFMKTIDQIFRLPIGKLWEPPVVEQPFVLMVIASFFGLLENPEVIYDSECVDHAVDFLGYLLKLYKEHLDFSMKMIELAQRFPQTVPILISAVHLFVTKYEDKSIVTALLKELGCIEVTETERLHAVSQFIMGITEQCWEQMLASVKYLLPGLQEESHIMRNCVLSVLGELTVHISKSEEEHKEVLLVRDELIGKIVDHISDINSFVRSKCFQIAAHLAQEGAIPASFQQTFLDRAILHLMDKSSTVRKYAIHFLKIFVLVNPFAAQIELHQLQTNYEKEKAVLKELMPQMFTTKSPRVVVNFDSDEDSGEEEPQEQIPQEEHGENGDANNVDVDENSNEGAIEGNENEAEAAKSLRDKVAAHQVLVECLEQRTLHFAEAIIKSLPTLCTLLLSTTTSDVLEAIDFFVVTFQLGLKSSVTGIKAMMHLIFSKEPTIKSTVVAAYKKLYLTVRDDLDTSTVSEIIAQNLVVFLHGASDNEVQTIEEFVNEFMKSGDITPDVLNILWDNFMLKLPETTDLQSTSSIMLLSMAANVQPDIVTKKLDVLVEIGLGPRSYIDFQLAKETCNALLKINRPMKGLESSNSRFRLAQSHKLFCRLSDLLVKGVTNVKDNQWIPMSEKAVDVIFRLADHPEEIVKNIIHKITKEIVELPSADPSTVKIRNVTLCRLLFICGHFVYCYMVSLETNVFNELKRRADLKSKNTSKRHVRRLSRPHERKSENADNTQGAENDDFIGEFIHKICDHEILEESNLFGELYPFILKCCEWALEHQHPEFCAASSLALAKVMTINEAVCEDNMQLLVTIMEKFPDECVRSGLIIALSDLLIKFPNIIQPWTSSLYGRLKDDSVKVRSTAVVILYHLILHDMVKVKGQIGEIGMCITDEEIVSNVAKHLFRELSKKQNTLYNVLPDLISTLSDTRSGLNEADYQTIIKYIFQFVEKDRQIEGLVEKLCYRLRDSEATDQLHKLAYTLGQLNFNEKSVRKLIENKACFVKKLEDEILAKFLREVLNNCKKNFAKLEPEIDAFMVEIKL